MPRPPRRTRLARLAQMLSGLPPRSAPRGLEHSESTEDRTPTAAARRCESLAATLETVLHDQAPASTDSTVLRLSAELVDAAADVCALLDRADSRDLPLSGRSDTLDRARLLRHDLAAHVDRLAALSNAGSPPPPAALVEVTAMRRLVEHLVADLLRSAPASDSSERRLGPGPQE